jgi:hypothetical protein
VAKIQLPARCFYCSSSSGGLRWSRGPWFARQAIPILKCPRPVVKRSGSESAPKQRGAKPAWRVGRSELARILLMCAPGMRAVTPCPHAVMTRCARAVRSDDTMRTSVPHAVMTRCVRAHAAVMQCMRPRCSGDAMHPSSRNGVVLKGGQLRTRGWIGLVDIPIYSWGTQGK